MAKKANTEIPTSTVEITVKRKYIPSKDDKGNITKISYRELSDKNQITEKVLKSSHPLNENIGALFTKVEFVTVSISPDKAKELIENWNHENRPLDQGKIAKLTAIMKEGEWVDDNELAPIGFFKNGIVATGQHRLIAQVLSNTTVSYSVLVGASLEKRNAADFGNSISRVEKLQTGLNLDNISQARLAKRLELSPSLQSYYIANSKTFEYDADKYADFENPTENVNLLVTDKEASSPYRNCLRKLVREKSLQKKDCIYKKDETKSIVIAIASALFLDACGNKAEWESLPESDKTQLVGEDDAGKFDTWKEGRANENLHKLSSILNSLLDKTSEEANNLRNELTTISEIAYKLKLHGGSLSSKEAKKAKDKIALHTALYFLSKCEIDGEFNLTLPDVDFSEIRHEDTTAAKNAGSRKKEQAENIKSKIEELFEGLTVDINDTSYSLKITSQAEEKKANGESKNIKYRWKCDPTINEEGNVTDVKVYAKLNGLEIQYDKKK